jgi:hypothetical protein
LLRPDSRRQRVLNEPNELFTRLAKMALVRVPRADLHEEKPLSFVRTTSNTTA